MIGMDFVVNANEYYRKMGAIAKKVIPYVRVSMEILAKKGLDIVEAHTPPTRTGRTKIRELWKMTHSRKGTIERYLIRNLYKNKDVLMYMEEGTPAHVIKPRLKKMLRWVDEDTKEQVFAKIVHHPGTPAYHMVAQTQKEVGYLLNWYIKQTFQMVDRLVKT